MAVVDCPLLYQPQSEDEVILYTEQAFRRPTFTTKLNSLLQVVPHNLHNINILM